MMHCGCGSHRVRAPLTFDGIDRGKAEDTYQNGTWQNAERRGAQKQTWGTQTRESGKKTGPGDGNGLEAVAGQKNRKDLQDGDLG